MPNLYTSLLKHDLGYLRIVAGLWGLELDSSAVEAAAKGLSTSLLDPDLLAEILEALNSEAQTALEALGQPLQHTHVTNVVVAQFVFEPLADLCFAPRGVQQDRIHGDAFQNKFHGKEVLL